MHLVDAAVYNLQALAERGRNTLKRCFSPVLDSSVPLLRKTGEMVAYTSS